MNRKILRFCHVWLIAEIELNNISLFQQDLREMQKYNFANFYQHVKTQKLCSQNFLFEPQHSAWLYYTAFMSIDEF